MCLQCIIIKPFPRDLLFNQAHPQIREECKTAQCAALTKHFEDCQTKVLSGQGFKGEDCVEELFVSSRLFSRSYSSQPFLFYFRCT